MEEREFDIKFRRVLAGSYQSLQTVFGITLLILFANLTSPYAWLLLVGGMLCFASAFAIHRIRTTMRLHVSGEVVEFTDASGNVQRFPMDEFEYVQGRRGVLTLKFKSGRIQINIKYCQPPALESSGGYFPDLQEFITYAQKYRRAQLGPEKRRPRPPKPTPPRKPSPYDFDNVTKPF